MLPFYRHLVQVLLMSIQNGLHLLLFSPLWSWGELKQCRPFTCTHFTLGQIFINFACLGFSLPLSYNSEYTWGRSRENSGGLVEVSSTTGNTVIYINVVAVMPEIFVQILVMSAVEWNIKEHLSQTLQSLWRDRKWKEANPKVVLPNFPTTLNPHQSVC